MIELKPCPFCGGNDIQIDEMESFWDKNETIWRVLCINCIAETAGDTKEQAIAAWNRRSDAVPVVRGEWIYAIEKGLCYDYHVTAKCSECGWDWFSADGVGNYSAVFGAFITNGDSKPEEAERFLLENARANNKLNYCPNCGAKMGGKP